MRALREFGGKQPWSESSLLFPVDHSNSGSKTQSLEQLVEDDNDVKINKLVTRDSQSQTNKHGVEDNTKFQNENVEQLSVVVFFSLVLGKGANDLWVLVFLRMLVMAWRHVQNSGIVAALSSRRILKLSHILWLVLALQILVVGLLDKQVSFTKVRVAVTTAHTFDIGFHPFVSHEFGEKHHHQGNQTDTKCHWIASERLSQTLIS
ncbi:hypothetical protein OGATHE_001121 [Ogataea polymorpha]|uniref:Uncharacterized protein n=1 Tax=Ogataea polymorpha TaxID=460523 RepID=A0A9P8PS63_9ASCO|nr:hypothetical protein OGATHE_001121 [Ogataea polymorpha]